MAARRPYYDPFTGELVHGDTLEQTTAQPRRPYYDPFTNELQEFEPPPAPDLTEELTDTTSLADYGKSIMSGGAGVGAGIGWLMKRMGGTELGGAIESLGNDAVDYWNESLSEGAKAELAKEFVTRDENGEWQWGDASLQTVGLYGAQSLLGTAAGMGTGAGITKVLQVFGNPVGRAALVNTINAGRGAAAGSATARAATAAAKKLKLVDRVLGATGFGLGEGAVGGMMTGVNVEDQVRNLTDDKLLASPRFNEILESNLKSGVDEATAFSIARDTLAKEAASMAGYQAGLTTALLGAPMGAFFGPLFSRVGVRATGRGTATAIGAVGEAAQEFGQSGFEAYYANMAMNYAGDPVDLFDDVLNQAVGGALAGGLMGGGFGFAAGADQQAPKKKPKRVETVEVDGKKVNTGPLRERYEEALALGIPKEELAPIIARAAEPAGLMPAVREIRQLIDAKQAETPSVDEALEDVEATRPPKRKGKRGKKKKAEDKQLYNTLLELNQEPEAFGLEDERTKKLVADGYAKETKAGGVRITRKGLDQIADQLKDAATAPESPPTASAEPEVSPPETQEIVQEPSEGVAEAPETGFDLERLRQTAQIAPESGRNDLETAIRAIERGATPADVVESLQSASDAMFQQHPAISEVVDELIDSVQLGEVTTPKPQPEPQGPPTYTQGILDQAKDDARVIEAATKAGVNPNIAVANEGNRLAALVMADRERFDAAVKENGTMEVPKGQPVVMLEYEYGTVIDSIGAAIAQGDSKPSFGKLLAIEPVPKGVDLSGSQALWGMKKGNRIRNRQLTRNEYKLALDKPALVNDAVRETKTNFLRLLSDEDAALIKDKLGLEPDAFWRNAKNGNVPHVMSVAAENSKRKSWRKSGRVVLDDEELPGTEPSAAPPQAETPDTPTAPEPPAEAAPPTSTDIEQETEQWFKTLSEQKGSPIAEMTEEMKQTLREALQARIEVGRDRGNRGAIHRADHAVRMALAAPFTEGFPKPNANGVYSKAEAEKTEFNAGKKKSRGRYDGSVKIYVMQVAKNLWISSGNYQFNTGSMSGRGEPLSGGSGTEFESREAAYNAARQRVIRGLRSVAKDRASPANDAQRDAARDLLRQLGEQPAPEPSLYGYEDTQDFGDLTVSERVIIEETGETVTVTHQAQQLFDDAVRRRKGLQQLVRCLNG